MVEKMARMMARVARLCFFLISPETGTEREVFRSESSSLMKELSFIIYIIYDYGWKMNKKNMEKRFMCDIIRVIIRRFYGKTKQGENSDKSKIGWEEG